MDQTNKLNTVKLNEKTQNCRVNHGKEHTSSNSELYNSIVSTNTAVLTGKKILPSSPFMLFQINTYLPGRKIPNYQYL